MKKLLLMLVVLLSVQVFSSAEELSHEEIEGIVLMREEEKLARDVYVALYDIWGLKVFDNISKSEQTHMDRVKTLIDGTDIADPVAVDVPGSFQSEELQHVYNNLIEMGSKSIENAVKIGMTIEDLDIYDLEELMAETKNPEILNVYTNLRDASINHLNSFNRQLERYNESYTAQYISDEYLKELLSRR